jgi:hypothetical protein
MSLNVNPTFFAQQFKATLELALQQRGSRLRPTITNETTSGVKQAAVVDRLEVVNAARVTGQLQTKNWTNAATNRRWVLPVSADLSQIVDHFDKLRLLNDPTSKNAMAAINAIGRDMDDEIIAAFWRAAATGETGASTTAFDATNQVVAVNFGAAANTGLTVAKLREARRILLSNEADMDNEQAWVIVTSKQADDLLREAQIVSRDYNDSMVLRDGKLESYLGFKFLRTERLVVDGSSFRRIPAYVESAMNFTMWEDVQTSVNKRTELRGEPYEVYSMATYGATRTDEKRIVEIKCA